MTSEDKVLAEIKEKIQALIEKIVELKVTEDERKAWEEEKRNFQARIDDYKIHKRALEEREKCLK